MGGNGVATIQAGGPQYTAELRILLVYLSESLGRLGQNGGGGTGGQIFHWAAAPWPPCRTAPACRVGYVHSLASSYSICGLLLRLCIATVSQVLHGHKKATLSVKYQTARELRKRSIFRESFASSRTAERPLEKLRAAVFPAEY